MLEPKNYKEIMELDKTIDIDKLRKKYKNFNFKFHGVTNNEKDVVTEDWLLLRSDYRMLLQGKKYEIVNYLENYDKRMNR